MAEKEIEIIRQTDKETIVTLAKKYEISESTIDTMILQRALDYSGAKITKKLIKSELKEKSEEKEIKITLRTKKIASDNEFKELVTLKKNDLNILELGIEEMELVEKLISTMNGEPQGYKGVKTVEKTFDNGTMTSTEEGIKVENFPSVSEQTRATLELHKLGFLNAKDKSKIELEEDKFKNSNGDLVGMITDIMKMEERGKELDAIDVPLAPDEDEILKQPDEDVDVEDLLGDI